MAAPGRARGRAQPGGAARRLTPAQRLASDELSLEVLPEAGGRIHRLQAFGLDLLRTPADPAKHRREPFDWGCFPLVPWSNRVPGGRLAFRGETYQLPLNFGDCAIHGEAYLRPWSVLEAGARLRLGFEGGGGRTPYPWPYRAEQAFTVEGRALSLEISVTNLGGGDMPAGLGIHPWFAAPSGLQVEAPLELAYPLRDQIPAGEPEPVAGKLDLRRLREVPWGLDNLWTGFTRFQVRLERPRDGIGLRWSFSPTADHLVLASFADLRSVAIEPVTHATDGFRRLEAGVSGGIGVLAPGETLAVLHVLEFGRTG